MLLAPRIPCSNRRVLPKTEYDMCIASSAEMFARDERARCARLARFPAAKPQETTARPRQHSQAREQVSVAPLTGAALQEGFERAGQVCPDNQSSDAAFLHEVRPQKSEWIGVLGPEKLRNLQLKLLLGSEPRILVHNLRFAHTNPYTQRIDLASDSIRLPVRKRVESFLGLKFPAVRALCGVSC